MALFGKSAAAERGGQLGINLFLPGSDTRFPAVWSGVLGAVGRDDEDVGDYPCGVHTPDYEKSSKAEI